MWGTLFKVFTDATAPLLKPVLEQLVKKAIESFLKNLGNSQPGGLTLSMTAEGSSDPAVDAAIAKTVDELLGS